MKASGSVHNPIPTFSWKTDFTSQSQSIEKGESGENFKQEQKRQKISN